MVLGERWHHRHGFVGTYPGTQQCSMQFRNVNLFLDFDWNRWSCKLKAGGARAPFRFLTQSTICICSTCAHCIYSRMIPKTLVNLNAAGNCVKFFNSSEGGDAGAPEFEALPLVGISSNLGCDLSWNWLYKLTFKYQDLSCSLVTTCAVGLARFGLPHSLQKPYLSHSRMIMQTITLGR